MVHLSLLEKAIDFVGDYAFMTYFLDALEEKKGGQRKLPPEAKFGPAVDFKKIIRGLSETKEIAQELSASFDCLNVYYPFLVAFSLWTLTSRRVYHLGLTLQRNLLQTCWDNILWKELLFPFDAFMLRLDDPLVSKTGELYHDILVARLGNEHRDPRNGSFYDFSQFDGAVIRFFAISSGLGFYEPIPSQRKRMLYNFLKKRNAPIPAQLLTFISTFSGWITGRKILQFAFPAELLGHFPITREIDNFREGSKKVVAFDELHALFRKNFFDAETGILPETNFDPLKLIGATIFLLNTYRDEEISGSLSSRSSTSRLGEIVGKTDLCDVSDLLTKVFSGSKNRTAGDGSPKCLHARARHRRRGRGKAHLPHAPKEVIVPASIVRRELLGSGELLHGSNQELKHQPTGS